LYLLVEKHKGCLLLSLVVPTTYTKAKLRFCFAYEWKLLRSIFSREPKNTFYLDCAKFASNW